MNLTTGIGWTDATWNPLRYRDRATGKDVWACVKVSSGCANCYSEASARRYGRGGPFTREAMAKVEPYISDAEINELLRSKKVAGKRVFVADMTDLFGDWVPDELIDRVFAAMALRSDVTFQVLTKRAERMREYATATYVPGGILVAADDMDRLPEIAQVWPLPNVWLGVSVENQDAADERIPHLLQTPAAVRYLSCEPLLGPIDLRAVRYQDGNALFVGPMGGSEWSGATRQLLSWIILGGGSGPRHRSMEVAWAQSLRDQCRAAGVACYVKQDSGPRPGQQGRLPLDVWDTKEFPA